VLIVKHGDHSTYEIKGMNNGDADSYERPSCGTRYGPQGFSYHGKIQCSTGCHP
jgi:hypothetical protein